MHVSYICIYVCNSASFITTILAYHCSPFPRGEDKVTRSPSSPCGFALFVLVDANLCLVWVVIPAQGYRRTAGWNAGCCASFGDAIFANLDLVE